AALVEEAELILSMMPWAFSKPQGLSDTEPFHNLWRFLGPNWLSGSNQNDMLELLRQYVASDPILARKFRIQGTSLGPKILEAYEAGAEAYKKAQSFRWIRDLASDIIRNQAALITTTHLGEIDDQPHWVSLVFDMSQPEHQVLYGDSFGQPIPPALLTACRWWISQHTDTSLVLDKLPMGPQTDGFSCGMLADNGQQH
ncbi:hypothetical protein C8R43DRAFT_839919, partial [Mycena crocata]